MENNLTFEIERLKKEVWDLAKNTIANLEQILSNLDLDALAEISSKLEDLDDLVSAVETNTANISSLQTEKVDKVTGKGLSSNDYTNEEKQKLAGIESGANNYVLPNTVALKSEIPSNLSDLQDDATHRVVTDTEKQTWNNKQAKLTFDTTPKPNSYNPVVSYGIKNALDLKANASDIPTKTSDLNNDSNFISDANYVHTDNNFTTTEKTKLSAIESGAKVNVQSNWNESDSTSDAFIQNKPTIPNVNDATLTIQKEGTTVATFSANALTNASANIVETDPVFGASAAASITSSDITTWNNKQAKLTFDTTPKANSYNPVVSYGIKNALDDKANTTDLATVATSGNYNDLSNKPITSITYSTGMLTITI